MMEGYFGCYRGVIADTADPEIRGRYRVRITVIHPDDLEVQFLPWAEMAGAFAAKDASDLPHYEVGERVWVMFEGGDPEFPVILGGWVSQFGGTPDLPVENAGNYTENRKRWRRQDRTGNVIELSELNGERHVLIQSGGAIIRVTQRGDTIILDTEGVVEVKGGSFTATAKRSEVVGDDVTIQAQGDIVGLPNGKAQILSNSKVIISGGALLGSIDIGQFIDELFTPRQTTNVTIGAVFNQLGIGQPKGAELPSTQTAVDGLNVSIGSIATALTQIAGAVIEIGGQANGVINIDNTGGVVNIGLGSSVINIG